MSGKNRLLLLNVFLDLQRSAVALYQNPKGKNHKVFFNHAVNLLKKLKDKTSGNFLRELVKIEKSSLNPKYKADKILTTSLMLKPSS